MGNRILVVDDSETNTLIIGDLINDLGLSCDVASSGTEAIEMIKTRTYSIVFTDKMMPDLSGFDVAGIIREQPTDGFHDREYYVTLPFICITAEVTESDEKLSKSCGINEIITKPISRKDLSRCINFYGGINSLESDASQKDSTVIKPVKDELLKKVDELKEKLPSFDINYALENIGGDPDYFIDVLNTFMKNAPEKRKNLSDAFENKKYSDYTVFVHGLKGDFTLIGATGHASIAKFLEINGKMYTGVIPSDVSKTVCLNNILQQTPGFLSMFDALVQEIFEAFPERFAAEESKENEDKGALILDNDTLGKLRRYITYSKESINDHDITMAVTWLDECIDIIDKAVN